jgi:hypothetical protein
MIRTDLPPGTPGRRSHNNAPEAIAARRPGSDATMQRSLPERTDAVLAGPHVHDVRGQASGTLGINKAHAALAFLFTAAAGLVYGAGKLDDQRFADRADVKAAKAAVHEVTDAPIESLNPFTTDSDPKTSQILVCLERGWLPRAFEVDVVAATATVTKALDSAPSCD